MNRRARGYWPNGQIEIPRVHSIDFSVVCGSDMERSPGLIPSLYSISRDVRIQETIRIVPGGPPPDCWQWIPSVGRLGLGRNLLMGEFACAVQHQLAYRAILAEPSVRSALIVEDDCHLTDMETVTAAADWVSGTQRPVVVVLHELRYARPRRRAVPMDRPLGVHRVTPRPTGTVAYIINAAAARRLAVPPGRALGQADWPAKSLLGIGWYRGVGGGGRPCAVEAETSTSTIAPSKSDRATGTTSRLTSDVFRHRCGDAGPLRATAWILHQSIRRSVYARLHASEDAGKGR